MDFVIPLFKIADASSGSNSKALSKYSNACSHLCCEKYKLAALKYAKAYRASILMADL
jgi:hypothetical protein